jgi:hypothetical protein
MAAPFLGPWICGKHCQRVLAGFARRFWQELPTNVGKHWLVRDAAKKRTGDSETSSPWPGATPEARRDFGVIATPKMGLLCNPQVLDLKQKMPSDGSISQISNTSRMSILAIDGYAERCQIAKQILVPIAEAVGRRHAAYPVLSVLERLERETSPKRWLSLCAWYRPGASLTKQTGSIPDTVIDLRRRVEGRHALESEQCDGRVRYGLSWSMNRMSGR